MSFSQAQLDKLNSMIASGVLKSEYDGQRIEYRSLDELIRARDMVAGSITGSRQAFFNPAYDKGV